VRLASPLVSALLAALLLAGPAGAAEPKLTVSKKKLAAALHCHGKLRGAKKQPLMLVTGTGYSGAEAYAIAKGALDELGHPVCYVDFPHFTTADVQVSVQYLVYGLRTEARRARRPIAVYGVSQGGLLVRWALTYWPSLRPRVTDAVTAAGTHHGTNVSRFDCSASNPCPPAYWQQHADSNLLRAINRRGDETPGPTAWTTIRSANDQSVQPQTGEHPTSALKGATNILIQDVCPGREVNHIGTAVDSIAYEAFIDAISHRGAARVSRLPDDACSHPYARGLDEDGTRRLLEGSAGAPDARAQQVPRVAREPKVKPYALRRQ
jgi:triacylglycerol lipase